MPGKKGLEFACEKPRETSEQVLKALSSLETTEEKLAALCKKYTELLEEHRNLQTKCKQTQKSMTVLLKEKEQLQSEHSKAVLAKSKLESLCRELQRHNKLIKEESLARAKEEEEKRKEVTSKFQTTINDIQSQMNDHYSKNTKLREENTELANKLKTLIEQYELREQHIEKVLKHKELESQLAEARLAQCTLQANQDKEMGLQEKEMLLKQTAECHKKLALMETQEIALKEQVQLYAEKYEEFQSTLAKSNDVFSNFKTEMDKMTKKIKKLEKETGMWRSRWENSNRALLEMAEDKTKSDKEKISLMSKIKKLESLCRVMQEERRQKSKTPDNAGATVAAADSTTDEPAASEETDSTVATTEAAAASSSSSSTTAANVAATAAQLVENGTTAKMAANIEPTKTPPNTPDQEAGGQSRASPVTVGDGQSETPAQSDDQSEAATQEEEEEKSEEVVEK